MTPAQALTHLNKGDPERIVPPIYRRMPRAWLRDLVRVIGPGGTASPAASVQTLLQRAVVTPERLRTPARRQAAFLQHFAGCRTIVEAHGGKIWVEDRQGGGTVFRFTLRIAEVEEAGHAG